MNEQVNSKLVGGFVIGAVVLVVIVFMFFGSGKFFANKDYYVIYFREDATGLDLEAPVKVRGVQIGKVNEITPLSVAAGEIYIQVIIEVYEDVIKDISTEIVSENPSEEMDYLVKKGLRAQLAVESLMLGKLSIKLDYFPDTEITYGGFNDEYIEIPSIKTTGEEMFGSVENILKSVEGMRLQEISTALLSIISKIDATIETMDFKSTFASLNTTLRAMEDLTTNMDSLLEPVSGSVIQTSGSVNETLEKFEQLAERFNRLADENQYYLKQSFEELILTSRSLRNLTEYLQQHPSSLIFGKD